MNRFLPNVRGGLVHRLRRSGFNQPTIAKMVGVTQSAVSQILHKDAQKYHAALLKMGLTREEVDLLLSLLEEDVKLEPVRAVTTLYAFWRKLLGEGRLCTFHRAIRPELGTCELCISQPAYLGADEERAKVLSKLNEAVRLLELNGVVSALMPQVSMNLVYSVANPRTISDIAGIPGRIVRFVDGVKAVGRPAFGGSHHLATVLLAVNSRNPAIRAAVNIKNDERIKMVVESLGLPNTTVQQGHVTVSEESIIDSVAGSVPKVDGRPVIVFHEGGYGYEPTTYIFGENPVELARLVISLARKYLSYHSQT